MRPGLNDDDMPEIVDFSKRRRRGPPTGRRVSLSTLRAAQGLTQAQFATRTGISQSEVSRAELRSDCLVSTLERYAKGLGGELVLTVKLDGRSYPIALRE